MSNLSNKQNWLIRFLKHTPRDEWLYSLTNEQWDVLYDMLEEKIKEFEKEW